MRNVGTKQDQVTVFITFDAITDVSVPTAINSKSKFEFRMVMPLEGHVIDSIFEMQRPRVICVDDDLFEIGLHNHLTGRLRPMRG
jgi:hypothetical protein